MSLVEGSSGRAKGALPMGADDLVEPGHYPEFRALLRETRAEIRSKGEATAAKLRDGEEDAADPLDRASADAARALLLRERDRDRKLLVNIEAALGRIEDGTYGYCMETGDPMPLGRLRARPTATLCVEAQERRERREKAGRA